MLHVLHIKRLLADYKHDLAPNTIQQRRRGYNVMDSRAEELL